MCERDGKPLRSDSGPETYAERLGNVVGVHGTNADPAGQLIYVIVARRDDFDRIELPLHDHGAKQTGHVLTKALGSYSAGEVTVIFQHWLAGGI